MQAAVATAGGFVHQVMTRNDPAGREAGVWLPDEDDRKEIAEPLASLASRRAPAAVTDNPDATDLLQLGAALLNYVVKSLGARAQLAAAQQAYYDPTGDAGADVDPVGDDQPDPATVPDAGEPVTPGRSLLGRRLGLLDVDQVDAGAGA